MSFGELWRAFTRRNNALQKIKSYKMRSRISFGFRIVPYRRKKVLYGKVRKFIGLKIRELVSQRGSEIIDGHLVQSHCHMLIRIPPKHSVSEVIGTTRARAQ